MGLMWDLRPRPKKPRKILMILENYDFVNDYYYSLSLLSGTLALVEFLKKFETPVREGPSLGPLVLLAPAQTHVILSIKLL